MRQGCISAILLAALLFAAPTAKPRSRTTLGGVRGASVVDHDQSVKTAWPTTTGRPDVTIAVLDSGIKWNDLDAMRYLRKQFRLNRGELEQPSTTLQKGSDPSADCSSYADAWDANGDGVFNVLDYACDSRVDPAPPLGDGPVEDGQPLLDPQDVLIAFTDGPQVVVALARSGTILAYRTDAPACSPSSWPRFHHDEANSGDLRRDATPPGAPAHVRLDGKTLRFTSPGDDLLCGRADPYELSVDGKPFTRVSTTPVEAGSAAAIPLSGARPKTVSVRAVDEQGNLGRAAAARR